MSNAKNEWVEVKITVGGRKQKDVIDTSNDLVDLVEKLGGKITRSGVDIKGHQETIYDICRVPIRKLEDLHRRAPEAVSTRRGNVHYEITPL